jgi:hypothetical protein
VIVVWPIPAIAASWSRTFPPLLGADRLRRTPIRASPPGFLRTRFATLSLPFLRRRFEVRIYFQYSDTELPGVQMTTVSECSETAR